MCYIAWHESTQHGNNGNHAHTKQNMRERNWIS